MTYEVLVGIALVLNTLFAAIAIWQRHQTIKRLRGEPLLSAYLSWLPDKLPKVHQPRNIDMTGGTDEAREDCRQDEGVSKDISGSYRFWGS